MQHRDHFTVFIVMAPADVCDHRRPVHVDVGFDKVKVCYGITANIQKQPWIPLTWENSPEELPSLVNRGYLIENVRFHSALPNVQIEGRAAFGASFSNAMLERRRSEAS